MTRRRFPAGVFALWVLFAGVPGAHAGSSYVFASREEAREVLAGRDDFVSRMSPFDRSARLKTGGEVSEAQYLAFAGASAVTWDGSNQARVQAALKALAPQLARLSVPLPDRVLLIQTSGREEGQAEYTRGNAIVLPQGFFRAANKPLEFVLAHELFHILSRRHPDVQDKLYGGIGFVPCGAVALPETLAPRRITNPDAPVSRHCIGVTWNGAAHRALPVLYADPPAYDPRRGGEFFEYLQFRLLLEGPGPSGRLVHVTEVGGFFEKVGRNTQYIIHPEEILADNFAQVMTRSAAPQSPQVHDLIRSHLLRD